MGEKVCRSRFSVIVELSSHPHLHTYLGRGVTQSHPSVSPLCSGVPVFSATAAPVLPPRHRNLSKFEFEQVRHKHPGLQFRNSPLFASKPWEAWTKGGKRPRVLVFSPSPPPRGFRALSLLQTGMLWGRTRLMGAATPLPHRHVGRCHRGRRGARGHGHPAPRRVSGEVRGHGAFADGGGVRCPDCPASSLEDHIVSGGCR